MYCDHHGGHRSGTSYPPWPSRGRAGTTARPSTWSSTWPSSPSRKNDDRLISLSVGIKTASKEDIAQHELRKYKGSRMASFRVHNHLASMKNSTMAYRTWKGSRVALTKKELLT